MSDSYLGVVKVKDGLVVWSMTANEARELADAHTDGLDTDDLAWQDAEALRDAADAIDSREAPHAD